jgi:hypothetical protein
VNRISILILFLILLQLPVIIYQIQIGTDVNEEEDLNLTEKSNNSELQTFIPSLSLIESNEHGGSWLDSFNDLSGINNKTAAIEVSNGTARFSPKTSEFFLTATSDFDAGTKINISTSTDKSSIPQGEIQMTPTIVFTETFDGPDGLDVTDYNSTWKLRSSTQGTARLDQNEKYGGNASLKMKSKTSTTGPYYVEVYSFQNHSKLEFYMKFTNNGVGTGHYSLVRILRELSEGIIYNYGASGQQIRYYDGKKIYHTGSLNFNTWYKFTLEFNFATSKYNGWVDGGIYSNYLAANNCAFYDTMSNPWANVIWLNTGTAWKGVNVTTWYDNITLYGYPQIATWESDIITLPSEMRINEIKLEHYNLTEISNISKIQWVVNDIVNAEYDVSISKGSSTVITESNLTAGSFMAVNDDFSIRIYLSSNQARSPAVTQIAGKFESIEGVLISKPISRDPICTWDTLVIDKVVPSPEKIKVSILDNSDIVIPGFVNITSNGEIDISGLDGSIYPIIKLKAQFLGHILPPKLNYWGVSWNASNAWRDTFFRGDKVNSSTGVDVVDGYSLCPPSYQINDYLRSTKINVPPGYHFDTLLINKSESVGTSINLTIFDAVTNATITGFQDMGITRIDLSSIDTTVHPKIWLLAALKPYGNQTPILYDWSLNWILNITQPPTNISKFIDIDPDTLNLKSNGRWITCYIEPQNGSDPAEINISTILLNGTIPAEEHPATVGDYDNDSLPDLMVKFNRSDVQKIVTVGNQVGLFVEGYYNNGTYFNGSDIIRVINPGNLNKPKNK